MNEASLVVLVEDNPADVFLVEEALRLHGLALRLVVLDDGEKAIQWIAENDAPQGTPRPAAMILDLNLPKRTGAEVLGKLRDSQALRDTPVIIFTSSSSYRDRALSDSYPHTRYVCKSADYDEFMEIGGVLKNVLAGGHRERDA
ncbi:MAG: response regulator [Bryobacterales bacterium]|nr:response regulator [Bryobacterales bacterium]